MQLPKFIILLETLVVLLTRAKSQEISTPPSLLSLRYFKTNPFDHVKFLKTLKIAKPTNQGPVLFPNNGPTAPRPPLIVTSRPLTESIARSELNNTITSQSQLHGFLAETSKDYRPFVPTPSFEYKDLPSVIPYAEVVKKNSYQTLETDNRYNDSEEQTILPPIYTALGEHAKKNLLIINEKPKFNNQPDCNNKYQNNEINHDNSAENDHEQTILPPIYKALEEHSKTNLLTIKEKPKFVIQPDYNNKFQNNKINHDNSADHDHNKNYAFSYTVKDQKTGDDFSHSQHSSGSATNGEYRVRLPDGRMQIVSYTADENGYKADVRYDEEKTPWNFLENDYYNPEKYAQNYFKEENSARNDIENEYVNNFPSKTYEDNVYENINYPFNRNIGFNPQNTDYTDRLSTEKIKPVNEKYDYLHQDNSKEDFNDYSSEYNKNIQPYKSKFAAFAPTKASSPILTPNFKQLKDLLVTKNAYKTAQNYNHIDLNKPSTTPLPYGGTTEHVAVINKPPTLYTNIRNSLIAGPASDFNRANLSPVASYDGNINLVPSYNANINPGVVLATTPRSYLFSTIASLKNKVGLNTKPILSDSYINKINKYLVFN